LKFCPICNTEIELPNGGVGTLPDDFMVNSILGVKTLKEEKTKSCDLCDEGSADCAQVYCKVKKFST
jgi:hypothetical protein